MVREHQGEYPSEWAAIQSISAKFGCTAETLRRWLRQTQKTNDAPSEASSSDSERIKALEREVRELRQANEILRIPTGHKRRQRILLRRSSTTRRAQAPVQTMNAFVDEHRKADGVEPICKVLPIAPAMHYRHAARTTNPEFPRSNALRWNVWLDRAAVILAPQRGAFWLPRSAWEPGDWLLGIKSS